MAYSGPFWVHSSAIIGIPPGAGFGLDYHTIAVPLEILGDSKLGPKLEGPKSAAAFGLRGSCSSRAWVGMMPSVVGQASMRELATGVSPLFGLAVFTIAAWEVCCNWGQGPLQRAPDETVALFSCLAPDETVALCNCLAYIRTSRSVWCVLAKRKVIMTILNLAIQQLVSLRFS